MMRRSGFRFYVVWVGVWRAPAGEDLSLLYGFMKPISHLQRQLNEPESFLYLPFRLAVSGGDRAQNGACFAAVLSLSITAFSRQQHTTIGGGGLQCPWHLTRDFQHPLISVSPYWEKEVPYTCASVCSSVFSHFL